MVNLDPHQRDGVPWLLERPRAMLAWEMGVGKTAPLIRAWEAVRSDGPLLVMCLASARQNWAREIAAVVQQPTKVKVIFSGKDFDGPAADVVVCNYDKLLLDQTHLRKPWGTLVLDEAHALKNPDAKRTKRVYGPTRKDSNPLVRGIKNIWLATGTPMPNHPGELYSHARALWPERMQYNGHMMARWEFEAAFCDIVQTRYGPKIIGARNMPELKARLNPVISVLKRKDVLTLPPCKIESWPLDGETGSGHFLPIPDLPELLGSLIRQYGAPSEIDNFDEKTLDAYLACIMAQGAHLATIRRETSILKAIRVGFMLNEEFACGSDAKTVVFAHHREAIATLKKLLASHNPAVLYGDVPGGKRQDEIDRFQVDPNCRIFIGQLTAAGSSINLQAASNVIFVESSWSPGDNEQALSRVYRRGQKNKVYVRFGYLAGTIDEAIQRALARKSAMIAQMF